MGEFDEAREAAFDAMAALGNSTFQAHACRDHSDAAIDAFLSALRESGHVIAPREPTESMVEAGAAAPDMGQTNRETIATYRAMIAAL